MVKRSLHCRVESFPLREKFVIARGSRTEATVLTAELKAGGDRGWGESAPSVHYGETPSSVLAQIESARAEVEAGAGRCELLDLLPAGAGRNALDAALWDLEARATGVAVARSAGLEALDPVRSVHTISVGPIAEMAAAARRLSEFAILKLKLDGGDDAARVAAVKEAAPGARLIVDANESWPPNEVSQRLEEMAALGVELVEQPTAPEDDDVLLGLESPLPVCADEAFHTTDDLDRVAGRYQSVNLKLDKTGGLTHALEAREAARERGLGVMVGCMLGTSLAMAPALVLAQGVDFVDLDGPLLLERDRSPGLVISAGGRLGPNPDLWGG